MSKVTEFINDLTSTWKQVPEENKQVVIEKAIDTWLKFVDKFIDVMFAESIAYKEEKWKLKAQRGL